MRSGIQGMANREFLYPRPIKTKEVAEYMGLSTISVLRMVHAGVIPAKRVGNAYYYDPRTIVRICGIEEEPSS